MNLCRFIPVRPAVLCLVAALSTCATIRGAETDASPSKPDEPAEKPVTRIVPAIYSRPAGQGTGVQAKLIGDYYHRSYSSAYDSPYRYRPSYQRYDYGRPRYYSNNVGNGISDSDFGDPGSWYQPRSYRYTSRYPFSSTQVPSYRYPFSREYYSYGPGYSNYGYAFGYPFGWYGGFGYWGWGWGGPWFPYHSW